MRTQTLQANETVFIRDMTWLSVPKPDIAAFHFLVPNGFGYAACDKSLVDKATGVDVATVAEHKRCRRPGCKQKWDAFERNLNVL